MISGTCFRRVSVALVAVACLLAIATNGWADYVGSLTNRIFLDPATVPAIIDGYQNGDEVACNRRCSTDRRNGTSFSRVAGAAYVPHDRK